jgi:GTPase SAR1 family protein
MVWIALVCSLTYMSHTVASKSLSSLLVCMERKLEEGRCNLLLRYITDGFPLPFQPIITCSLYLSSSITGPSGAITKYPGPLSLICTNSAFPKKAPAPWPRHHSSSSIRNACSDELRASGISRYIDLPQLIICGDQSSGKSSVLEAISGVRFPIKDGLCTRFATELVLRRADTESGPTVTVVAEGNFSATGHAEPKTIETSTTSLEDLESIFERAERVMGINPSTKEFSTNTLRIEVSGPKQPHLTLVDLPGLFHTANKTQSVTDIVAVRTLVELYMKKPRSTILAVVSAKNEFVNQAVTKYALEHDSSCEHTLGIITKPDTLPSGPDSETKFVNLAKNADVRLRLGWHACSQKS